MLRFTFIINSVDLTTYLTCSGGGAFLGLGAYTYFSGQSQLQQQREVILKSGSFFGMRSRQAGITAISLSLAWAGLWRLFK